MKKYLSQEDFIELLKQLEVNKPVELWTESREDGSENKHTFVRIIFNDDSIILFVHPSMVAGIIQDTPVAPWEDYAELAYEDLTGEDEYKVFIK